MTGGLGRLDQIGPEHRTASAETSPERVVQITLDRIGRFGNQRRNLIAPHQPNPAVGSPE